MAKIRIIPNEDRAEVGKLVDLRSVADAMPAYFALEHPLQRTEIYGYYPSPDTLSGFLSIAQTGFDLFRPIAVPFVANKQALQGLFEVALKPGRAYLLYLPLDQQEFLDPSYQHTPIHVTNLLRLDTRAFSPILNVMIVRADADSGLPRFEIRSTVQGFAAAGVNWMSSTAVEVYVEADVAGRRRGFTKSVLSALIELLLSQNRIVLFRVADDDYDAFEDAFDLGFKPTGIRTLMTEVRGVHPQDSDGINDHS